MPPVRMRGIWQNLSVVRTFGAVRCVDWRSAAITASWQRNINPQGLLTVWIGKTHPHEKVAALRHPQRDTLHLSCSGADVSFLNIDAH